MKERTLQVKVEQWVGGVTAGKHGIPCYVYADVDGEQANQMYGLSLHNVLGLDCATLGEGSELEVTVRIVKRRKGRINPWWKQREAESIAYSRKMAREAAKRAARRKGGRRARRV